MARVAALPPRVQDLALALALTIFDVAAVLPYESRLHPLGVALTLIIAQSIPLIWRRSWPVPVLIASGAARVTYDALGFGFAPFQVATTLAFFTVMERSRPWIRWITVVLTAVGTTISEVSPGHTQPYDATVAAFVILTAWYAAVLSRARRAYIQEVEDRATQAEAERDDGAARAAAEERTRIARELHDVVAHHVSLMAVQAEAATSLLPGRPADAARSVEIIAATARQALTELRRLLGVLRGPSDHLETAPSMSLAGLGAVLDQMRGAGLPVELTVLGTPVPLAPGIDLTAYRIVQEALTNTLRHARASRADVTLCYEPGFVTVGVTDSGRPAGTGSGPAANGAEAGTNGAGLPRSGGFGLAGIAERVASCGGNLAVGPSPGGGFAITARLPAQ
jgi:signal transduction histidine kinase